MAAALAAVTGDEGVTSDTCNLPSCVTQACQQLLLQTACNCMLWAQSAEGREATGTLEASTAVHDLFLAVCCVLGQQQYLQHTLTVWGQQQHQHQQQQGLLQRNQGLRQVLECVGAAPAELRLHVAVEMAAAAVVQPAEHDTSTDGDDAGLQQVRHSAIFCGAKGCRDRECSPPLRDFMRTVVLAHKGCPISPQQLSCCLNVSLAGCCCAGLQQHSWPVVPCCFPTAVQS